MAKVRNPLKFKDGGLETGGKSLSVSSSTTTLNGMIWLR